MKNVERWILGLFSSVDNTALGFFTKVGPYITAAIPALLAGYGLYKQFSGPDTDQWFGVIIGVAVGVGFEAAGIKIIHTAIEYNDQKKNATDIKFILLVLASLVFVGLVSFTIFTADKAYPWIVRVVGGISPTLAALAYFSIGVEKSLGKEVAAQKQKEQIDLQLYAEEERQRRNLQLERERLDFEDEKSRKAAETLAYQQDLEIKVEERRAEAEHKRHLEDQKELFKQEKALKKMDQVPLGSPRASRGKPFRKYDEFEAAYTQTGSLEAVSEEMGLTMKTIRGYKRKFDQFNADLASSTALQDSSEETQPELNGHT